MQRNGQKIKIGLNVVHFEGSEGDLKEKNHVSRKITMLSGGHWTLMQLAVFKVLFSLGSSTSPEMFRLYTRIICQIVSI